MTDKEIVRFRSLIEHRLAVLTEDTARGTAATATVTLDQQSVGRLSRQDALINQSMAKAQQARRMAEAERLRAALIRIETKEFGYCDDCGEPIAARRLELDPTTIRCINCASQ